MPILDSELLFYLSETVSDDASNGGRLSSKKLTSGAVQNVFAHVYKSERDVGSTKFRKIFLKPANDEDLTLHNAQIWLDVATVGDDWVVMFAGTQRDTQADINGSERLYGCANLQSDVSAGLQTIVVEVEDVSITGIFQPGDTIRVTDKLTPTSGSGNTEWHEIASVSVNGTQVTITTVGTLGNGYTVAGGARVSSVFEPGDIYATTDNYAVTGLTYDEQVSPVQVDHIGTIEQTWTITGSDSSHFTCVGDKVGQMVSGSIGSVYAPINPQFSKPYFTLPANSITAIAAGQMLVFQTHPAACPVWEKRVVPPAAASVASNKTVLAYTGESA